MPPDYRKTVLLGDRDPDRSALLADVIRNDFRAEVVRVEFFDDIEEKVVEALRASTTWKLVILAADLEESFIKPDPILPYHFFHIAKSSYTGVGCVYTHVEPPDPDVVGCFIHTFYSPPAGTPDRREVLIKSIADARAGGLRLWKKPTVELDDDPLHAEQVGALSPASDFGKAKDVLAYLIRDFQSGQCDAVTVSKLIQGASGAKVFRFRQVSAGPRVNERVLKIAHYSHEWKLAAEVTKHLKARETLGNAYRGHVPDIESFTASPDQPPQHITSYGDWRAIAYDFLGGEKFGRGGKEFGKFIDLETALIGSHEELRRKTAQTPFEEYFAVGAPCAAGRKHVLEVLLDWLCNNWYLARGHRGQKEVVWDYSDGPDDEFVRFPPYQLPARSKRYILNFLGGRKAQMGERLFDDWDERRDAVRNFVAGSALDLSGAYALAGQHSLILSPTHGDLNSNNILLWLDEEHPFLIDFPFYQESGHALQDFARLEVEVKFTLMDKQADSSREDLPALDYTHSQIPSWRALEEHVLRERWGSGNLKLPPGTFNSNVNLSHGLVNLIRVKARAVQQLHGGGRRSGFWAEYRPALLYHTLRAIGYDSLSPFKRLLAVFSAAELLSQCRLKRRS